MHKLNLTLVLLFSALASAHGVELVRLTPEAWDEFAPQGKEVDCIYGDFVLRNDQLVAVIAEPLPTRHANMTVRNVGAMLIDLTRRDSQSDQLSSYHPNGMPLLFHSPERIKIGGRALEASPDLKFSGPEINWQCSTSAKDGLEVTVRYTLRDGDDSLQVDTIIENPTGAAVELELSDLIRADRTFTFGNDEATGLFWANDDWFAQAYGVLVEGRTLAQGGARNSVLSLLRDGSAKETLPAHGTLTITRRMFPGKSLLEVRGIAKRLAHQAVSPMRVFVEDPAGPVRHAKVTVLVNGHEYGSGRTDADGKLVWLAPPGPMQLRIEALGRDPVERMHDHRGDETLLIGLPEAGYVVAEITDEAGGPIPCKVAFHGLEGTMTPDFGPDTADTAVQNLHYSHNGQFRQPIGPGTYEVIISLGPEYDAVFQTIAVARGKETKLVAKLHRVVDTMGWISSDFHSHSSPSGDNVSSQLGRVQSLLCEHVEFCPCTEHNRVSTYIPHLQQLGVEHLMATCSGMELTGQLLPVNHQNAFPLVYKPRTQDGGGPTTDGDPVVQIERLALWDDGSDKLVQENHPNLVQIIGDRDLNGEPDGGFERMFGFMDVIEVHPPEGIFTKPEKNDKGELARNPIFHWMQMLNLGYRIPGVVNTDAHYNFHESGGLRNYLQSTTDDPAHIDTMDMVHAAEAGHVIMTTGPFMEVSFDAAQSSDASHGIPGDDVTAPGGKGTLHVRVQCANWLDVNRVQVFLSGRPASDLNFTRRGTPERFSDQVVKFDAELPLALESDAHLIVAAIGEGLQLGRVMGPNWAGKYPPIAVSNPIFVDIDGDGFNPNHDLLDLPLPIQASR